MTTATPLDLARARREGLRWLIVLTLNNARMTSTLS